MARNKKICINCGNKAKQKEISMASTKVSINMGEEKKYQEFQDI